MWRDAYHFCAQMSGFGRWEILVIIGFIFQVGSHGSIPVVNSRQGLRQRTPRSVNGTNRADSPSMRLTPLPPPYERDPPQYALANVPIMRGREKKESYAPSLYLIPINPSSRMIRPYLPYAPVFPAVKWPVDGLVNETLILEKILANLSAPSASDQKDQKFREMTGSNLNVYSLGQRDRSPWGSDPSVPQW